MTPMTNFQTETNLHSLKCLVPNKKPLLKKIEKKKFKTVDLQSYKVLPTAQGSKMGQNRQYFLKKPTSDFAIDFNQSYV